MKGGVGSMKRIEKPAASEYVPYAERYIGLLPDDGLVLKHLQDNLKATTEFILHERVAIKVLRASAIYRLARGTTDEPRLQSLLLTPARIGTLSKRSTGTLANRRGRACPCPPRARAKKDSSPFDVEIRRIV
jgi:hypothetical protein